MDNIVLCGFMGSGKTVVGRELAKVLGDESFMNDSYEDTEYFKTFFKL